MKKQIKRLPTILIIISTLITTSSLWAGSRETYAGKSYIKINIGELYIMLRKPNLRHLRGKRYVFQGMVHRSAKLSQQGNFGLMRIAIVCCLMDANVLGIVVKKVGKIPPKGKWLKVYGRFVKKAGGAILEISPSLFSIKGYPPKIAMLKNDYLFVPDKIVPIPKPKAPFVRKWKEQEPYRY